MSKFAEVLMKLAIDSARHGLDEGQSPFGCAIRLADGQIVSQHNTVLLSNDITAHAEINALRAANRAAGAHHLIDAIVSTTCEPCPMCMAALHWARVREVYYGATIADASEAGFNEINLSAADLNAAGGRQILLQAGILTDECRSLFREWGQREFRRAY